MTWFPGDTVVRREGHGVLMLHRPGDWYSVWAFWRGKAREFAGWYVNVQEPFRRGDRSYDTQDLERHLDSRRRWWGREWASWAPG